MKRLWNHLWNGLRFEILFSVLLAAFTAYTLLDTFVIPRQYAQVEHTTNAAESTPDSTGGVRNSAETPSASEKSLSGADAEELREMQSAEKGGNSGADRGQSAEGTDASGTDRGQPSGDADSSDTDSISEHRKHRRPGTNGFPWPTADGRGTAPTEANSAATGHAGTDGGKPDKTEESSTTPGSAATDGTTPGSAAADSAAVDSAAAEVGEVMRTWSSETASVTIRKYHVYDTDVYAADVTLASPEYLKTALAGDTYGRNIKEKTSVIASENNAVFAVNGDYYGARNQGYVIRNGVLYRDQSAGGEVLAIMKDGSFQIVDDRETTAQDLLDAGAEQALSFGPALLKDGTIAVTEGQEIGRGMASNPRTAIGTLGDLHYVFVVADGRTEQSKGLSLHQLAEFLQSLGADTAYNLDGGGSSSMVFQGEVINCPTTNGSSVKERSVSDIVYICP